MLQEYLQIKMDVRVYIILSVVIKFFIEIYLHPTSALYVPLLSAKNDCNLYLHDKRKDYAI